MDTWITPSLIVTDDTDITTDAIAAFQKIKEGDTGRVRSFDAARDTMTLLGMSEEMQDDRIHFALTGRVLSVR